jgi:site-specific DNA-methyltransferase (adenine-specific)
MIPADEAGLRAATGSGRLHEGDHLDLKRELPGGDRGSNSIAVDLASFALAGGTILVGVDEGPPAILTPVTLRGQRERVEQIARSSIDPPLRVAVREIAADGRAGDGYLVIEVPPSVDAPHSVAGAFRGRSGTTNTVLTANEVRRLHERGPEGGVRPITEVLRGFVALDPTQAGQRRQAHLFIVARPLRADVEMAVRLVELRRVLKPTGSLYLHCDSTASHYLKLVLDALFSPVRFLNEITWKRSTSHGNVGRNYGSLTDTILVYTKGDGYTWNQQYRPFSQDYIAEKFNLREPNGRRYQTVTLRNPGPRPNLRYPFTAKNGVTYQPHPNGWAWEEARLRKADEAGLLHYPAKPGGQLRLKMYLDEGPGVKLQNLWDDIPPVNSQAKERLGWETQKPVALLERIITASSNPGDIVLDPFCGCGTALVAAQKLDRQWVGIDVTYLSIAVMKARLKDSFGLADVEVIGQPTEIEGARAMLVGTGLEGQYQFQWWALDLVGAQPQGDKKKGADKGVDGIINFTGPGGKMESVIVSVKSGGVGAAMIQQLKGAMETHGAAMGLFVTLEDPTGPMKQEAAIAGTYHSEVSGKDYPRLQILTIRELLEEHRKPDLPLLVLPTYQKAERVPAKTGEQRELFGPG